MTSSITPSVTQSSVKPSAAYTLRLAVVLSLAGLLLAGFGCARGKQTAAAALGAGNYEATDVNHIGSGSYLPGALLPADIVFLIADKNGVAIPGVNVEFKVFDITGVAAHQDGDITASIDQNWDASIPVIHSDGTTAACADSGNCTPSEIAAEKIRLTQPDPVIWLGQLSGQSTTSNTGGNVSTAYAAPRVFDRTIAVAMHVPSGTVAANLTQFIRVRTLSMKEYLAGDSGTIIQMTLASVPTPVVAGAAFDLVLRADIPDTGADTIPFNLTSTNVPASDAPGSKAPAGVVQCSFLNGECPVPGGPYKVMGVGSFSLTVDATKITNAITNQVVNVVRGPAVKMVLSGTPPDKSVTPICVNPADPTTVCMIRSADQDSVIVYPALVDDAGNYVGNDMTQWTITGPLDGLIDGETVPFEQTIKPHASGSGTISVKGVSSGFKSAITYEITAGVPATYTLAPYFPTGASSIVTATVPFAAAVNLFDRKSNQCNNFDGQMSMTFGATNAAASSPPAGSGWSAVQPAVSFQEDVAFVQGTGSTVGNFTLVYVPQAGDPLPQITAVGGVTTSPVSSGPITVQAGPTSQSLLRSATGGLGLPWNAPTAVQPNLEYFFVVAGYDPAGNYTGDVFSRFYGVVDDPTVVLPGSNLSQLEAADPSAYSTASTCPVAPAAPAPGEPASLFCPIHLGLTVKSGTSVVFTGAGFPGSGRILAVPQVFSPKSPGTYLITPSITNTLAITSGTAVSFSYFLTDAISHNQVPMQPGTSSPQLTAGQTFNVTILARDSNGNVASGFVGQKTLSFVSRANSSWGGQASTVPNGDIPCTFADGSCTLLDVSNNPVSYQVMDSTSDTPMNVQDVTAGAGIQDVPKVWTTLIHVVRGADSRIYVVDHHGGPGATPPATILSQPLTLTADQEQALAAAVTDKYGNWTRDLLPAEQVWDGTVDITTVPVPNATNSWVSSDIFAALTGFNLSAMVKYLLPTDPHVLVAADKNSALYDIVYQPANRTGFGYFLVKSSAAPALVSYPSPLVTVVYGVLDHTEYLDSSDLTGAANSTEVPGACFTPQITLHDRKHNIISDYTVITPVGLKMFVAGTADPTPGIAPMATATTSALGSTPWTATNVGPYPTAHRAGFTTTAAWLNKGPQTGYMGTDPYLSGLYGQLVNQDFWYGNLSIVSGQVSFPGKICLFDAKTTTKSYSDREVQIEIGANTVRGFSFAAFASRGPGTLGSTALPHSHPDSFRAILGQPDHVHFVRNDSVANPGWLGVNGGGSWGYDPSCPTNFTLCGPQTIYFHKHDSGCNFLGAASPTGATMVGPFPASEVTVATPGALGSAAFHFAPHTYPSSYTYSQAKFTFTNNEVALFPLTYNGAPRREGFFDDVNIYPGAPVSLSLAPYGNPTMSVDSTFAIEAQLLDQFGNVTGGGASLNANDSGVYNSASRRLTYSWDAVPGPAPKSDVPVSGGPYILGPGLTTFTGDFISPTTDFQLFDSSQIVHLTATMTDQAPSVWYGVNKTYTSAITLNPASGSPISLQILNAPSVGGLPIADGTNVGAGGSIPLYACLKDQEGNINTCITNATWNEIADTPAAGAASGKAVINFFGVTSNATTSLGAQVTAYGVAAGTAAVQASITQPITATATTGTLDVPTGLVSTFSLAAPTTINAGVGFAVTVTALDKQGNVVSSFSGLKSVTTGATGDLSTSEGLFSVYPQGVNNLNFVAGVASFGTTIYKSGNNGYSLTVNYAGDSGTNGPVATISTMSLIVKAGALDHYTTNLQQMFGGSLHKAQAMLTPDNNYALASGGTGSRFDLVINGRDQWGNNLDFSPAGIGSHSLTISMRKSDGVTVAQSPLCQNNGTTCLTGLIMNSVSGTVALAKLASQVGGSYYLWATDASIDTHTSASDQALFTTSHLTVAKYAVTPSSNTATAGSSFSVQVTAQDVSGQTVTGADTDLSSGLGFTWTDGNGTAIPNSQNGSGPTLPASMTFSTGSASPLLTFVKVQTLKIRVADTQANVGVSAGTVTVWAASSLNYDIAASSGGTAIPDNTSLTADGSVTGLFDLTITATDGFGNTRAGEGGVVLMATPVGSALQPAPIQNTAMANTGHNGGIIVSIGAAPLVLHSVYYPVAQKASFSLAGSTGTVASFPTLNFTPTINTVFQYSLTLSPTSFKAGDLVTATVRAQDYGLNTVDGIDALAPNSQTTNLNNQTYMWLGAGVSPAPSSLALTSPTPAGHFSHGIATVSLVFHKAEAIIGGGLSISDNYPSAPRFGYYLNPLNIAPGTPSQYVLTPSTTQPQVGQTFLATLAAQDPFNNPEPTWTSDSLTWAWSGSSSTINTTVPTTFLARAPVGGTTAFAGGSMSVAAGSLYLYRLGEMPTLTVTGTNSGSGVTASGEPLATSVQFTPQTTGAWAYSYITNGVSCNGNGDCGVGSTRQTSPIATTVDSSLNFYAHGFDAYGNNLGMPAGNWMATAPLNVTLSPANGSSTTTMVPVSAGTGTISFACSTLTSGCVGDTTGTITDTTGNMTYAVSYPTSVTAGTQFNVTVTAQDSHGNTVSSYAGSQAVNVSLIYSGGVLINAESQSLTLTSGSRTLTFTAGVTTFPVTVYSTFVAARNLQIQVTQTSPSTTGTGPVFTNVTPGALNHYVTNVLRAQSLGSTNVVQAKSTLDAVYADTQVGSTYGTRFNAQINARDQWGNQLNMSGNSRTLTLAFQKTAGGASALPLKCIDGTQACLSGITLNSASGAVSVTGLGFDLGGTYTLNASDSGGIATTAALSDVVTEVTSRYTVNHYSFTAVPTNATAGTGFVAAVAALDNNSQQISGADVDLSSMSFAWNDGLGSPLGTSHLSANGTAPVVNGAAAATTTMAFATGAATATVTLYKVESLGLMIVDNQTTPKSGTSASVAVAASPTLLYKITSSLGAGSYNADPSTLQTLTIKAYDPYDNLRAGDSNATLVVIRQSGAINTGNLEGTAATVQNGGLAFNALSNSAVISGAYYRVAQTVTYGIIGTSGTVTVAPVHTFTSTIDSVAGYSLSHATAVTAADGNLTATLSAQDPAGNTVATAAVDTALKAQTYTWTPVHASPATTAKAPVLPATGIVFTNGVASPALSLYKAEPALVLTVTDSHNNLGIGNRAGSSASGVTVGPAAANRYLLTSASTSPAAGTTFDVAVAVHDQYDNQDTLWTSDSLTFAWSGASPSVVNPATGSAQPVTLLGPASRSFGAGTYTTVGGSFSLMRAGETPTLTVTGTQTAGTKLGAALTTTLGFTPVAASATGYVLVADSSTCSAGLGMACGGSTNILSSAVSMTTDQTKNLYAQGFDIYGNYKGLTNSSWSATGELSGMLSATSGAFTSTLAPVTPTTAARTVTATCSAVSAGCVAYTTASFTVTAGGINKLAFVAPGQTSAFVQTTESCSQLTLQTEDSDGNPRAVVSGTTINLTSTGGNGDFFPDAATCNTAQAQGNGATTSLAGFGSTSTLGGSTGNRTVTLPASASSVSVYYANTSVVASGGVTIQASSGSWSASLTATNNIGLTRRMAITTAPVTMNAMGSGSATCSAVAYVFQDKWTNATPLTAASVVTWQTSEATGGNFYSDTLCSAAIASGSRSVASAAAGDTVYYSDSRANTATLTARSANLSGNASLNSPTLVATVLPGSFTITGVAASGTKEPSPVSLAWGTAAGANGYNLSWGTTSACGTSYVSNPIAATSLASLAFGTDAVYYFCVTANPYSGSGTTAATNSGSYNLTVDSTTPTAAVTQPGAVTYIGPSTTATHTVNGLHTTFAGTASDNLAGVASVSVQLQRASDSKYYLGSSWGSTATWLAAAGTATWSYSVVDTDMALAGDNVAYTLTVKVVDAAGNVASSAATSTFTWKSVAPTATLTGTPFNSSVSSSNYANATSLGVTVAGTLVQNYYYMLVSGTSSACPATIGGYTNSLTAIASTISGTIGVDGQYTLCVLGVDQAQNIQAVASRTTYTWYKETVSPAVSITSANNQSVNSALTPAVTATNTGGQTGSVLSYLWSGTATHACTIAYSPSNTSQTPAISVSGCTGSNGVLSLTLTATNSGGTATTTGTFTINWDTSLPTVSTISTGLAAGSYSTYPSPSATATIPVTVTFTKAITAGGTPKLLLNTTPAQYAVYASGSGSTVLTFNYTVTAGDNTSGSLDVSASTALILNGGTLKDAFGNAATLTVATGQLSTKNIVIDTQAPTLAFVLASLPASMSNLTTLAIQIQSTDTTSYKYAIVPRDGASCGVATFSGYRLQSVNITDSISGVADGSLIVCAIAKDAAGNIQSTYSSSPWTKDTVAPTGLSVTGPTTPVYNNTTPTITWGGATDLNTINSYSLYIAKGSDATCASPLTGQTYTGLLGSATSKTLTTALVDGGYSVCLFAFDPAGNQSARATYAFQVETDTVMVSYTTNSGSTYAVNYGSWTGGAWTTSVVKTVSTGSLGSRSSLALSSTNVPFMAYDMTDASSNTYLYQNSGTAWTSEVQELSSASSVGLFPSIALDSTNTPVILAQSNSGTADNLWTMYGGASTIDASLTGNLMVNDTAVAVGTSDSPVFYVYSYYNGTNWGLRYRTSASSQASRYENVPQDASCTDAVKASIFVKPTGTAGADTLGVAYTCVTSGNACKVFYVERTTAATGSNGTASGTWGTDVLLGQTRASCTVATLTGTSGRIYRPSVAIDRQSGATKYVHVAWYDYDNNQIHSNSNESGSWPTAENVASSLTGSAGEPTLALDPQGHSYILYQNNGGIYMTTNNGRSAAATSGSWSTPQAVVSSGVIGVGSVVVSGMMGRSNNGNK